jgi:hypothetical protein
MFTLGSFFNKQVVHILGYFVSKLRVCIILTKRAWLHFWAIFSKNSSGHSVPESVESYVCSALGFFNTKLALFIVSIKQVQIFPLAFFPSNSFCCSRARASTYPIGLLSLHLKFFPRVFRVARWFVFKPKIPIWVNF